MAENVPTTVGYLGSVPVKDGSVVEVTESVSLLQIKLRKVFNKKIKRLWSKSQYNKSPMIKGSSEYENVVNQMRTSDGDFIAGDEVQFDFSSDLFIVVETTNASKPIKFSLSKIMSHYVLPSQLEKTRALFVFVASSAKKSKPKCHVIQAPQYVAEYLNSEMAKRVAVVCAAIADAVTYNMDDGAEIDNADEDLNVVEIGIGLHRVSSLKFDKDKLAREGSWSLKGNRKRSARRRSQKFGKSFSGFGPVPRAAVATDADVQMHEKEMEMESMNGSNVYDEPLNAQNDDGPLYDPLTVTNQGPNIGHDYREAAVRSSVNKGPGPLVGSDYRLDSDDTDVAYAEPRPISQDYSTVPGIPPTPISKPTPLMELNDKITGTISGDDLDDTDDDILRDFADDDDDEDNEVEFGFGEEAEFSDENELIDTGVEKCPSPPPRTSCLIAEEETAEIYLKPNNYKGNPLVDDKQPQTDIPTWYHGPIGRSVAEAIVGKAGVYQGSFLVRDSESSRKDLTITIRNGGKVVHCRVTRNIRDLVTFKVCADRQFIDRFGNKGGPWFKTLEDMVKEFRIKPIPTLYRSLPNGGRQPTILSVGIPIAGELPPSSSLLQRGRTGSNNTSAERPRAFTAPSKPEPPPVSGIQRAREKDGQMGGQAINGLLSSEGRKQRQSTSGSVASPIVSPKTSTPTSPIQERKAYSSSSSEIVTGGDSSVKLMENDDVNPDSAEEVDPDEYTAISQMEAVEEKKSETVVHEFNDLV